MPHNSISYVGGERFGRLVIVEQSSERSGTALKWVCRCDCGATCTVSGHKLRSGHTKSCGCWGRVARSVLHPGHGMTGTPEYEIWLSMRGRCMNPRNKSYADYGGRGIYVDATWSDFTKFIADVGNRPSDKHSLDRINNDGPYSPENCRWATRQEQALNSRRNVWLTFRGRTMTVSQWAQEIGIHQGTISMRLKSGWPVERALTQAAAGKKNTRP